MIGGVEIIETTAAVVLETRCHIERHPIKKRRRNYRVVAHQVYKPVCYQVGNRIYIHPTLYKELRDQYDLRRT